MKHLIGIAILVLVATSLFAQQSRGPFYPATLFKSYTTAYSNASDDTTGYVTVPYGSGDILDASEVGIIWVSNDSVQAAVYVIGDNRALSTTMKTTYTDSISTIGQGINGAAGFAATKYMKGIVIKGPGTNRLPGCTRFKVGTVFTAAVGNRAAHTGKWYLYWRP